MIQIIDTNGSKDIQKMVQLMIQMTQMILMPQVEQCYLVLHFVVKPFTNIIKLFRLYNPEQQL